MHPYLFVKFAMWLSPTFEVKIIQWVYDNLIEFRLLAGDHYKGQIVTTSLLVAEKFHKTHDKVIRDIEKLSCSEKFRQSNFGFTTYIDKQGTERPMAEMTKDGFSFLVMRYTCKMFYIKEIISEVKLKNYLVWIEQYGRVNHENLYILCTFNVMAFINGDKFRKIIRRYHCDDEVLNQIREFIISTMIPDEDVIINHCIITVVDRSKRIFPRTKATRYFDVVFIVMYFQIGKSFEGEPILEITYDAAEELTKDEFERRKETLPAEEVLREAKEIINPIYKTKYNG